jgi:cytochrome c2
MRYNRLIISLLLVIAGSFVANDLHAQASVDAGKALFRTNCAQCHNRNMKDALTGPALGGVQDRWDGREELLYAFIRNSQAVIGSGDAYAVALYNQYNQVLMNPFPNLSDDDIASILLYVDAVYTGKDGAPAAVAVGPAGDSGGPANYNLIYGLLAGLLVIIALILARIISNLDHMNKVAAGDVHAERRSLTQVLTSRTVIGFVLFALVILGGYTTVNSAIGFGRQQNYAPEQPIKFSHATHAGLHQIDCQYCHDGARRSKHAVIPAANTCMNCHAAIKKGSTYGTAEITKIFASVGYDPTTDSYIENYESMSREEIEAVYKKWIADQYIADNELAALDNKGDKVVRDQWLAVIDALTHDRKSHPGGPIEWIRIHNMPDHVYFNHAQHVTVGGVECQTCHGKIEEMEVVRQYSTLSMGWCINCHRETEVKFTDNEYYQHYEKYHEELASGKRQRVTVEEIGGTECQKCHY